MFFGGCYQSNKTGSMIQLISYIGNMEVKPCRFGEALVRIRKDLGITQYELSKRSGISEAYLNKLEKAKREPKAEMIIRLGRALGISPGELLNEMDRLMRQEEQKVPTPM